MRLVRYGNSGDERPALLDRDGQLRSVRPLITDWTLEVLSFESLRVLAAVDTEKLPVITGNVRLATGVADNEDQSDN